ncbi:MAG: DegV family protein [Christensenellales bacterium]|jgi:DegV family protein with EDD domain
MQQDRIAILVDSGCDVPPAVIEQYPIYVLPLKINFTDGEYRDGVDITAEQVYERLPVEIPKTSLPSGSEIIDILDRIKADGYEKVLVVTISSGLSGTFNSIRLALESYEGLESYLFDTRNISIGGGILAIEAARCIAEGISWAELTATLPQWRSRSKVFFCVKTLEYLQKGGRIGLITALLGNALNLKPIISCNEEGIYYSVAKCLGRKASVRKMLELAQEFAQGAKRVRIALMHGSAAEEAAALIPELEKRIPHGEISVQGQISPSLGVHTGPGLIGVGILRIE